MTRRARRAAAMVSHLWPMTAEMIQWLRSGDEHYFNAAAASMVQVRTPGRPVAASARSLVFARRASTCALAAATETDAEEWTLAAEHAAGLALEARATEGLSLQIDD